MQFLKRFILLLFVLVQELLTWQLILFQLVQPLSLLEQPLLLLLVYYFAVRYEAAARLEVTGPQVPGRYLQLVLNLFENSALTG